MAKLSKLLGLGREPVPEPTDEAPLERSILQQEQQENLEMDITILEDEDGAHEQQAQKVATREVQSAAVDSLKKLHVIKMGRCPVCGEHLRQHLFATICESCGWHMFDMPQGGPVRVHLRHSERIVEGERCYTVKTGTCLVLRDDLVVAKIPRDAYDWIEYVWNESEIDQRHKQVVERMQVTCGWCGEAADTDKDGFHMVHVAFGATQERYCFCSDDCYEAFRKMFPARVHRNCYERNCAECNLCLKRYGDEAEGIRMLAKDYLTVKKKKI
jgi:ribosomal protein L32